jgi:nucleotide-binding universal stress UspA family protein
MSDFPGKILLATEGSEDAMLAARAAISLASDTDAELHVVHVGPARVYPPRAAGPTPPMGTDEEIRREAQGVLDWQVDEINKAGERWRKRTCESANQMRRSCASARR